jgi:hypothetical protein
MSRSERISVRVTPDRKAKWESVLAESNEWHNLTHLVVQAVENEIGEPQRTGQRQDSVQAEVDLSPVMDRLDGIQQQMSSVDNRLDEIDVKVDDSEQVIAAAKDIMEVLPRVADESELEDPGEVGDGVPVREKIQRTGSMTAIQDWAHATYGYPERLVTRALMKAMNDMATVDTYGDEYYRGPTRFYRVD